MPKPIELRRRTPEERASYLEAKMVEMHSELLSVKRDLAETQRRLREDVSFYIARWREAEEHNA